MEFKRKRLISFISLIFILFTLTWTGCRDKNNDDPSANIDKAAILSNMGQNIILKRFEGLNSAIITLENDFVAFSNTIDIDKLNALRNSFFYVYKTWETCSMFEFGPAEANNLRVMLNTFPTDTDQIISNIALQSCDLFQAQNIDATGLPALDFLLYGIRFSDTEVISFYNDPVYGPYRISYISSVISQMKVLISNVFNGWKTGDGNYVTVFNENLGTDVGSSLSMLVNGLNQDFEILKNARIGIPIGKKTLDIPLPHKAEAYYSGRSMELAVEHLRAIKEVYAGINEEGTDGMGLDDYIKCLESEGVISGLHKTIWNRFENIESLMNTISDPLSENIENESAALNELYNEILKQTVSLKTDMPSAIGVLISYQDNDGD